MKGEGVIADPLLRFQAWVKDACYISIITGKITGRRSMVFLQKRRKA